MRSSLELAFAYIAKHPNRKIFPIKAGCKTPPLIRDNLLNASNDPNQITAWHTKNPGCNWGLALKLSWIIVIDVDCKLGKLGQKTFDELDIEYGFPPTETVRSPSGGMHYYYEATEAIPHVFALGSNGFGLDIDSPNYVLIAGCELMDPITGYLTSYKSLSGVPTAIVPDWFSKFLQKRDPKTIDAETSLIELDQDDNVLRMTEWLKTDAPPAIMGSGGDQTTLKVAMRLRDEGISQPVALDLMAEHYNVVGTCDPEWSPEELEAKVRNGYAYASINAPGELTEEGQNDPEVMARAVAEAVAEFAADPLPTNEETPATKKADALAEQTREKVRDATKQIVARRGEERIWARAEIKEGWVWVADIKRFVWRNYPEVMWDKETFNDYFSYARPQGVALLSKALLDIPKDTIRKLISLSYLPGQPEFAGSRENRTLNLYKPSDIIPAEGDTSLWDAHLEYLFPKQEERDIVLNWCAWLLQNLSEKPKHALLVAGYIQGTGKSFITDVLTKILGRHNVQPVDEGALDSPFNEWALRAKLITIEELRAIDRGHVAKKLHPLITQEHIKVNDKNVKRINIENCFGFFMMTNDDAAISLDNSDRRYAVVRTHAVPKEKEYYDTLYLKCLRDSSFIAAVAYQLQHRDLAGYAASARAPDTHAKDEMVAAGMSDLGHWMLEHSGDYPLSARIISIDDVIEATPRGARSGTHRIRNTIAGFLRHRFKGVPLGQHVLPGTGGAKASLWAINGTGASKIEGVPYGQIYLDDKKAKRAIAETEAIKDFEE